MRPRWHRLKRIAVGVNESLGGHVHVSARRQEEYFDADSVREMIVRLRKSEKSEDTLRKDTYMQLWRISKAKHIVHQPITALPDIR